MAKYLHKGSGFSHLVADIKIKMSIFVLRAYKRWALGNAQTSLALLSLFAIFALL